MLQDPSINIYTHDVIRLRNFYKRLGFRETFRTPNDGPPVYLEITLDRFTVGIVSVEPAKADHGFKPSLNGRPIEIALHTNNADREYRRLTAEGAPSLSPPHDFLSNLRLAWVTDPDGNPIRLIQHRKPHETIRQKPGTRPIQERDSLIVNALTVLTCRGVIRTVE